MDLDDEELKATRILNGVEKKKSKADKMIENLGTNKHENNDFISYRGKTNSNVGILFNKRSNTIILEGFNSLRICDLKAINEKCKELRWFDE